MVTSVALIGRIYFTGAPALAVARQCLAWSRRFVASRTIDGRGLAEYDQIQRVVATTLAEVFAMDSVVRWTLLGSGLADRWFERFVTKNICARTAWAIVDRTVSLFGGLGFETSRSKLRRGADPLPLERLFRDARGFRIAGNVDVQLDNQGARLLLARYYAEPDGVGELASDIGLNTARDADLSPANRAHLAAVAQQLHDFARTCRELTGRYPDPALLFAREQTLVLLARIASELFTMSVVLGRTSHLAAAGAGDSQDLADVYCTAAADRLADFWRRLVVADEPDYAKISRSWLTESTLDFLLAH